MRLRDPQFEGQTKGKLGNTSIRTLVQRATNERLGDWLEEHPTEANKIVKKAIQAARARTPPVRPATRRAGSQRSKVRGARQVGRLLVANRDECELYIVEGNSAGGSAKDH